MTGHCDADVLAEYREGLLGRRRSARIRAHLAGCSRCASLASELAEVTRLLASAPMPSMPDELTARLNSVLAAESAARAQAATPAGTETPAAAAGSTGTAPGGNGAERESAAAGGETGRRRGPRPRPARSARPPRPWRATALRAASVTAVVLVIAGGGYGVSRLLQGGAGGTSAASGGASARHQAGHAAPPLLGPASRHPGTGRQFQLPVGSAPVVRSGTDYLPGRLPAQAEAVLARYPAAFAGKAPASASGPIAVLQGCVQRVTGGSPPRLVDVARYQGSPATVIMQPAAGGRPGQVWVVGPGCSASSRDLITHALLTGPGTGSG